jgi:hypothetical protein
MLVNLCASGQERKLLCVVTNTHKSLRFRNAVDHATKPNCFNAYAIVLTAFTTCNVSVLVEKPYTPDVEIEAVVLIALLMVCCAIGVDP